MRTSTITSRLRTAHDKEQAVTVVIADHSTNPSSPTIFHIMDQVGRVDTSESGKIDFFNLRKSDEELVLDPFKGAKDTTPVWQLARTHGPYLRVLSVETILAMLHCEGDDVFAKKGDKVCLVDPKKGSVLTRQVSALLDRHDEGTFDRPYEIQGIIPCDDGKSTRIALTVGGQLKEFDSHLFVQA